VEKALFLEYSLHLAAGGVDFMVDKHNIMRCFGVVDGRLRDQVIICHLVLSILRVKSFCLLSVFRSGLKPSNTLTLSCPIVFLIAYLR